MYHCKNSNTKYPYKRKKSRTNTTKQVSFRLDKVETQQQPQQQQQQQQPMVHSSITELLPSIDFTTASSIQQPPKVIGLLFAAKWCPNCTNVIPAIGKVMEVAVAADVSTTAKATDDDKNWLQMIYISSDVDELSIQQFKPKYILHVPFDAIMERTKLKQKFAVCAAKEMTTLQITTRRHGIPTLLLLNAATGTVVSETGVDDVMNNIAIESNPQAVLDQWEQLV
jgi:thiol-disulfide isomerase/thioredoxin